MTEMHIQSLSRKVRLQELARLLGGSETTRNTLANAEELLVTQISSLSHGQNKQQNAVGPGSKGFQSDGRPIIIGILQMSHVLLGPEKESNHYAL